MPDLQSSIDEGFLRSIILDVREFLGHEPAAAELSETALQRIASIILRYLISADSNAIKSLNFQSSDFDDILVHLFRFERQNKDQFLEQLQKYLSFMLFAPPMPPSPPSPSPERIEQLQNQQARFDRAGYLSLTANENILAQRKNDGTIVIVRPQVDAIDNQDLAEADQLCQFAAPRKSPRSDTLNQQPDANAIANTLSQTEPNDCNENIDFHPLQSSNESQSTNENEIVVDMVAGVEIGAVGGIASSQLPDLAKVSTTSSRILSLEDEVIGGNPNHITERVCDTYATRAAYTFSDVVTAELPMHQQNSRDLPHDTDSASADGNSAGGGSDSDVIASAHGAVESSSKIKNIK